MGGPSKTAMSIALLVLLTLTAPLVVGEEDAKVTGDVGTRVDGLRGDLDTARSDAEGTVTEARDRTQGRVDSTRDEARTKVDETRIFVEDTILTAWDLVVGAFNTAYGTAERAVREVQDFLTSLNGAPPPSDDRASSGTLRSQSLKAAVAGEQDAGSILLIAASGGALFLLATLLRRLAALGLIPLLSRISHDEIYNNDARRTINELVVAEPGLCLNDIVARLGYSRNAVSYHLFVLEKEEALVSLKDGKYRRYFTRNGKYVNGAKNVVAALRNETTLAMAKAVLARPGAIQRDLCVELGATPSAACWHAKRLLDLGVIRKERYANTVRYYPGDCLNKYDLSEFGLAGAPGPTASLA